MLRIPISSSVVSGVLALALLSPGLSPGLDRAELATPETRSPSLAPLATPDAPEVHDLPPERASGPREPAQEAATPGGEPGSHPGSEPERAAETAVPASPPEFGARPEPPSVPAENEVPGPSQEEIADPATGNPRDVRGVLRSDTRRPAPTPDAETDAVHEADRGVREPAAALVVEAPGLPRQRPREAGWRAWLGLLEASLRDVLASLPPGWQPRVAAFHSWASAPPGSWIGLGAATSLLMLLVARRLARRPGDLIVCIEYPAELRGSFSVQLTAKRPGMERAGQGTQESPHKRVSTRTAHHMVARETEFTGLRPRSYWIRLDGSLLNPAASDEVLRDHVETRCIEIKRRKTVRVDFDLRSQGCPLDVKVLWDGRPVHDASVAVLGCPETLRYARNGVARLELPIGQHRLAIGSGDRVGELDVEIERHELKSVSVELAGAENVVFKGCPPAIEPYLEGDLDGAAQALEREGQEQLAHVLRARHYEQLGEARRAAEHYETAGMLDRATVLLEQVAPEDSWFADACRMLADIFEREGQVERAAEKLEEGAAVAGSGEVAAELKSTLADLLTRAGDDQRSLDVLEQLRVSEPRHPNVTTRIETIRKKLSAERRADPAETVGDTVRISHSGSRYDILEQIGRGGMGIVFKARDRRLGRLVALKQLPENLRDHPTAVELFLREARAAAALNHTNIVTLFDADEEYGKFFLTMELLEGAPINVILQRNGPVTAQVCARLGLQIAAGLQCAHGQGIVHRDIKTANLFWTNDKVLKIMDFGLAKMIEEVRRATTVIGGTPYYMAPEQVTGKGVDARADIYAFGVTLFELLTGRVPFPDGDIAYHHRHTPPPDPQSLAANVPDPLAALILDMLQKQPEMRCANAGEVARRLGPLAE